MIFVSMGMEKDAKLVNSSFGCQALKRGSTELLSCDRPGAETERGAVAPLGDMALHHHTDPGAIIAFTRRPWGLQAHSTTDGWMTCNPKKHHSGEHWGRDAGMD